MFDKIKDWLKKPIVSIPLRKPDVTSRKAGVKVEVSTMTIILVVLVIVGVTYASRYLKTM